MRKYTGICKLLLVFAVSITIYLLYTDNRRYSKEISILESNQKAFIAENSSLKEENRVFRFNIEQLDYYNDSLLQKINEVRKELGIKDKNLKEMQYLASTASKIDTITFRDTIFRNEYIKLDTLIRDEWYNVRLSLRYPNIVITEPSFKSEKYIITKYSKETINPPKKFFIARWFQKKHQIMEVEVVEKSPYVKDTQQRFIEIVK